MSPVQVFALDLVMIEDSYTDATLRGHELTYAIKNALLAAGADPAKVYPETTQRKEDEVTDEDIDKPEGSWKFTYENIERDEIMDVLQLLGQNLPVLGVPRPPTDDPEGWFG